MKKTYYKKILLLYSLVLFCLLLGLFTVYFYQIQQAERNRVDAQDRVLFQEYVGRQEGVFEDLVSQASFIQNLDSLAAFALSSQDGYYSKMTELYNDLSKFSRSSNSNYMVHKLNDDRVLTSTHSSALGTQLEEYGIGSAVYENVLQSFSKSDRENSRFFFTDLGILYLTTRTYVNNRMVIACFAPVESGFALDEESLTSGFLLEDSSAIDERTQAEEVPEALEAGPLEVTGGEVHSVRSGSSSVLYGGSQYLDLVYYLDRTDSGLNVLEEVLRLIPMLLLLFGVSFLLIRYLSKKMYAPIDQLVNLFLEIEPDIGKDDETSHAVFHNEVEYLANQVSKIRWQNSDLTEKLSEMQRLSQRRFLLSLVQGTYEEENLAGEIQKYHLEWLEETNYILYCSCGEDDEKEEFSQDVLSIVEEKLGEMFQVCPIPGREYIGYFLVHTSDKERLKERLSETVTLISTAFGVSICFFIGKKSVSAASLQYSFMTIEKLEASKPRLPVSSIYDFSEMKNVPAQSVVYPISTENKLLKALQKGNLNEMRKALSYIFQEYLEKEFDVPEKREQLTYGFVNTINRSCLRENGPGSLAEQNVFQELESCSSVEEYEKKVTAVLEKLCHLSGEKEREQISDLKERIERYIDAHLSSDLSLISLSNDFHLSPNYMSSIFKTTMGENFKDYLSGRRFEKIKQLLTEHPELPVREAGEQAGIYSPTTLTRLFRKFANCSPGQFVEQIRRGEAGEETSGRG